MLTTKHPLRWIGPLLVFLGLIGFNYIPHAEECYGIDCSRQAYCDYAYGPSALIPAHVHNMVVNGVEVMGSKRAAADAMLLSLDQVYDEGSVGYDINTALYNAAADGAGLEDLNNLGVRMCMNSDLDPAEYEYTAP